MDENRLVRIFGEGQRLISKPVEAERDFRQLVERERE
jgi:hypothetical protein